MCYGNSSSDHGEAVHASYPPGHAAGTPQAAPHSRRTHRKSAELRSETGRADGTRTGGPRRRGVDPIPVPLPKFHPFWKAAGPGGSHRPEVCAVSKSCDRRGGRPVPTFHPLGRGRAEGFAATHNLCDFEWLRPRAHRTFEAPPPEERPTAELLPRPFRAGSGVGPCGAGTGSAPGRRCRQGGRRTVRPARGLLPCGRSGRSRGASP